MTTTRRAFTDEFKREAVALLAGSGRPLTQVATELGIQPSMLGAWRSRPSTPAGPVPMPARAAAAIPLPSAGAGRDPPPAERARSGADGARHFKKGHRHLLGPAEMRFRL